VRRKMDRFNQVALATFVILALLAHISPVWAGKAKSPGEQLFQANCVACHGDDGTAKTPVGASLGAHDLTSAAVSKRTDTELSQTITEGRNEMPSFAKKLSDAEIRDVIAYVRGLEKKN
jgi:mono/diheme cytochrome c family protein